MIEYLDYLWPWRVIVVFIILAAFLSIVKLRKDVNQLSTPKSVRIARFWVLLTNMLILVSIPTVIVELYMQFDDPKWKFLGGLCLLIVLVSEVIPVVKINIILFKPIRKAVAYSLAMQSSQENEKGLDVEAIKKIKVACDLDPEEPRHWLMFSVLERTRDTKKAKECLAIAENLVKEKGMRSKKIIAWMEFIKGNLILTEHGSRELALKHYKESLELDYDKERAEFIQKVANYSVKKEGVSNKKSVVSL